MHRLKPLHFRIVALLYFVLAVAVFEALDKDAFISLRDVRQLLPETLPE